MMTESEALTKWCPYSQIAVGPAGDVYANTLSGNATTCAASACMAWCVEWETTETQAELLPVGDGWEKSGLATGVGGAVTHRQKWKRRVGHCGFVNGRSF